MSGHKPVEPVLNGQPVLSGQPVLRGQLAIPQGWPFNTGLIVIIEVHIISGKIKGQLWY